MKIDLQSYLNIYSLNLKLLMINLNSQSQKMSLTSTDL
jgi:hypothetical protein